MRSMFRSFSIFNYRLWFVGALVSNVGTWMQRTAQDWIVLTELTDNDAAALGVTLALQLGPQLLLLPWSGLIADRFDRRRVLMVTQATMGLLAVGLSIIVLAGVAELWHLYAFAFALGLASAIDAPARQAFVSELVSVEYLPNAVALNSLSFHSARLAGPAVAGILIAIVGTGWVFVLNAATFAAVLASLFFMRRGELQPTEKAKRGKGQLREGFRYVRSRPDIMLVLVLVFLIGTFGMNFAIYTSTMTTIEFGLGASEYGALSSIMAIGSVAGALLAARRERARVGLAVAAAAAFGFACLTASLMPSYLTFAISLVLVGACSLTFMTSANAYVQTTTEPVMRGRVMALYMAVMMGGTPIGAPIVGWVTNHLGPRWGLAVAAIAGLSAAIIGLAWLIRVRGMRVTYRASGRRRLGLHFTGDGRVDEEPGESAVEAATTEIAVIETTNQRR
ncbi:MFS transporter [Salinibacterium sp. dk2585]|uniref:MFS transporter n=1 Tax=unclassified Salinibacterium TaxID=2632331 RepID=UPI0011C2568C|nr:MULTISPECIES: MFS transporter [unclassified Salinibacterium]QEE62418.1 MFS transporter [Salinibacterium sp. dk2585]TXK52699.1 MFS transporter [Salinibacterium sp. dk5596]